MSESHSQGQTFKKKGKKPEYQRKYSFNQLGMGIRHGFGQGVGRNGAVGVGVSLRRVFEQRDTLMNISFNKTDVLQMTDLDEQTLKT